MPETVSSSYYNKAYNLPLLDREALITSHLSQIKYIAERMAARLPSSVDVDDLISAGVLGLLDAATKYDPTRGVQFKTYAEVRVRGAILDSLRNLDWVPRTLRRRAREVEQTYTKLEAEYGRPASDEEVATALAIPLNEFHSLLGELRWLTITELDREDPNGHSPAHQLPDDLDFLPSAIHERREIRTQLANAIDQLPERERQVIALYYVEELTMKEIGAVLGITESRVCQLHTKAVLRLRSALTSHS